jgi:glycosyltransferase involved in cell wall biosynthesis
VEDYCRLLGGVFKKHGCGFELKRVQWDERGWPRALSDLWCLNAHWKGDWALVQYTALMWSRRGFPLFFLLALWVLKIRGAHTAVVFHDSLPFAGRRYVDKVRRACQRSVMRCAYRLSDATILPIPLEHVSWLPAEPAKATFIPVCATLPVVGVAGRPARNGHEAKTITVLGITDKGDIRKEVADITLAAKRAAEYLPHVRLVTVGRGTARSEAEFRQALEGSAVEYRALGVVPAEEVSRVVASSDVSLFVRGRISTQRSSAIASIANGVPLVAYAEPCLPAPLAEAGVVGVPYAHGEELAEATVRVLTDSGLWLDLHERSRRAYEKYFSWEVVASRILEVMRRA